MSDEFDGLSPTFCACKESAAVLFAKPFDILWSVIPDRNCLSYGTVCDNANHTREKDNSGQCKSRTHCQILLLEVPTTTTATYTTRFIPL